MKIHVHPGIFLTLPSLSGPLVPSSMHIRLYVLLLLLCLFHSAGAQYVLSRVTFPIDEHQTAADLGRAGIDLSHGHGKINSSFTTEAHDYELARYKSLGIRYTIDVPNLATHRKEIQKQRNGVLECQDDVSNAVVPSNFQLGSVGGFFSLPEVLDQLDAMAFAYPNLISVRKPIGNFKTWENNSIFWVRISDNPELDENEPELLYTSLIHAREFVSISQTIFYMWTLLENYHKDPMIKQMLDHTELYFIPVINPDGLNYNVQGYDEEEDVFNYAHRKNLRDNDENGVFDPKEDGVDLNRNFGSHWGHDDEGSSGFPGSSNYRGPEPFSEPETKAIRHFCETHNFKVALNYHSYGNFLIHPWGYNNQQTPDSTYFENYGQLLTGLNRFTYGLGTETVGYRVNGDSDDYMYDEHHIFAMTPEVGNSQDDFYPPRDRIIPLCKSTTEMNILAARLVNSLIAITDESPDYIKGGFNNLNLEFNRYGLLDGEVLITFHAISPEIQDVPDPITFSLDKFEAHERNLSFYVDEDIAYGSKVKMEVVCRQGDYTFRDTIVKIRADFYSLVEDAGDLSQWDRTEGQQWGNTTAAYKSGPVSISDSPDGLYGPNVNEIILLKEVVDLTDATDAYAQFWARWDIEDEYDYVLFQASTDGETWENICGERSRLGGVFQLYEQPLYDGKQESWVLETSDLQSYLGQHIQLRFVLATDGFVFKDGFYFDDFQVITIREGSVSTPVIDASLFSVYPNPAINTFVIEMPQLTDPFIRVYDVLGREVFSGKPENERMEIQTSSWNNGLYHYMISTEGQPVHSGLINVTK